MRRNLYLTAASLVLTAILWQSATFRDSSAHAYNGWEGERRISYQQQKICSNHAQPGPFYGTPSAYVCPQPVPPHWDVRPISRSCRMNTCTSTTGRTIPTTRARG
jgi:hypothetical protein